MFYLIMDVRTSDGKRENVRIREGVYIGKIGVKIVIYTVNGHINFIWFNMS